MGADNYLWDEVKGGASKVSRRKSHISYQQKGGKTEPVRGTAEGIVRKN